MIEQNKPNIKNPWIVSGYEIFGLEGPKGLLIERLARKVGKSKSSFYHHFSEIEIFMEELLAYHLKRAEIIRTEEKKCKRMIPDLLDLLISNKTALLFNRQLRINRERPQFQKCYEEASQASASLIIKIWSDYLGIDPTLRINQLLLELAIENFYLHITNDNLNYEWLESYIKSLKNRIKQALIA